MLTCERSLWWNTSHWEVQLSDVISGSKYNSWQNKLYHTEWIYLKKKCNRSQTSDIVLLISCPNSADIYIAGRIKSSSRCLQERACQRSFTLPSERIGQSNRTNEKSITIHWLIFKAIHQLQKSWNVEHYFDPKSQFFFLPRGVNCVFPGATQSFGLVRAADWIKLVRILNPDQNLEPGVNE